jgi:hypothetical protein
VIKSGCEVHENFHVAVEYLFGLCPRIVPKEHLKIARRFNAGNSDPPPSPEGTAEIVESKFSAVPSELVGSRSVPGVETPGYFRPSLRDDGRTEKLAHPLLITPSEWIRQALLSTARKDTRI